MKPRSERHRVNLTVKYGTARDFVEDYAENLSVGGLYVRGAYRLEPGQDVFVELELPGYGAFEVSGTVVHVLSPEAATARGRHPGAGISVVGAPAGYVEALRAYLLRLGKRRDHRVLVDDAELREVVKKAGYLVAPAPRAEKLLEVVSEAEELVIGVVVPRSRLQEYENAALSMGAPELVKAADYVEEIDELLTVLDQELPE